MYLEPIIAQATLIEAEKLEAEAEEQMQALKAYTQSSMDVARRRDTVEIDNVLFSDSSAAAAAEARARAARNAAEAARARLEEMEERRRKQKQG